jgi:hypothetical protein
MSDIKEKILSIVKINGPVLPMQIAGQVGKDSIFTGAILSDLASSKLVKISSARIGGSPVYYVDGQEEKLEKLYDGLAMREKEAYNLLKKAKFLREGELDPAIRVAMKEIKDFAKPIMVKNQDKEELCWRWHLTSKEEVASMLNMDKPSVKLEPKIEMVKKNGKQDDFLKNIEDNINKLNIRIFEKETLKRGREITMIVNIPSNIGNLNYFVCARNKKIINEKDLGSALETAKKKGYPLLFLSTGKLTKKAETYLEKEARGLITFKNI